MHPDQAHNTSSGIQGQEATAVAVIYVTAPTGGGHNSPGAELLWGRQIIARAPKNPNNVASTFFNTVYLLPKDLRFEHGGATLVSCSDQGRIHPVILGRAISVIFGS